MVPGGGADADTDQCHMSDTVDEDGWSVSVKVGSADTGRVRPQTHRNEMIGREGGREGGRETSRWCPHTMTRYLLQKRVPLHERYRLA